MKKLIIIIQLFFFLLFLSEIGDRAFAQSKFLSRPFENKVFIEEQGQFKKNTEEKKISFPGTILYAVNNVEFSAYFTTEGISFVFSKTEKSEKEEEEEEGEAKENKAPTKWETLNMQWVKPSASMQITVKEKISSYFTYGKYADNSQYAHVSAYKKLIYSNLYNGVDAEFELPEKGGIKYKFIVHAGYKIPAIAYQLSGTKKVYKEKNGDLHIQSSLADLIDKAPNAFTKSAEVPVEYTVNGDVVEINIKDKTRDLTEELTIDPWIINPGLPITNNAYDIQEDSVGNVFVSGGKAYNFQVQKYNSAGVWQWTHPTAQQYYGDIAVGTSGNTYLAESYSAKLTKLDPAGGAIYTVVEGVENWRLSFNKSKTILSMGGNFSPNSLTKIDTATGAMTNTVSYPSDTWAIATDCNGDIYSLHHGSSPCILRKTNSNFTPAGSFLTSPFCISGYNNTYSYATGYNALTISGPYLYVYDGLALRRFNKSTLTLVNSVSVANGAANSCSGIAFDYCGNIYVGTMSTVEKYDALLNLVSSIPAPNTVYDILLAGNGDLLVCGKSFVSNFGPTCPFPIQLSVTDTSTNVCCKPGSASVFAMGGTLPYSYLWASGGQTTSTITGLTAGTYRYTVNDVFCQSKVDSVTVLSTLPLALSHGTINNESCQNSFNGSATVNATGGKIPYLYSWNTTPAQYTQTVTGLSAGTYIATVVDADTCSDTISFIITRNPDPLSNFTNTTVCNSSVTQFTHSATTPAGTISTWIWNFNDGSPVSFTPSPSHTYTNAGNYNVKLIVTNSFGCADTVTKPVQVYYNPVANFTYNNICLRDTMHYLNSSTVDPSTSIASYLWVFGDGSATSTLQTPVHIYTTSGIFNVTLVATTADGCSDVANIPVSVFDPPIAAFTVANTCLFDSAIFTNTSVNPTMGSTASWSWNFGDGSPATTLTGFQTLLGVLYATPGNYQITLITHSSNLGCPDTLQSTLTVYPMPTAKYSVTDVCLNQSMSFHDSSTVANDSITGWLWDFGEVTPFGIVQNPGHIYSSPGIYTTTLIATTNHGCKDTISKSVVVHPLPVAQFSRTNVCLGTAVQFTDLSTITTTDTLQTWTWNFSDGNSANTQNSSHSFVSIGSYAVQLFAISTFGCRDSIIKASIIHPNPVVQFTTPDTAGCEPWCVNFRDTSSIVIGTNVAWLWNFGDGGPTSNLINPVHCYNNNSLFAPIRYSLTLTVTSDSGCVTTKSKNNYITVYPKPSAAFTVNPDTASIIDPITTITNLSIGANFWNWNFGATATDTSSKYYPTPHTYGDTGKYVITLLTSTLYNCKDTAYQTVYIEPSFLFYIPNAFTPNDDGINDSFSGKGIFIKKYEMSIFDRWRNLIFFTDDINKPWDGTANHGSEIAQRDEYVYLINVTGINKLSYTYKGLVTLVR